MRVQSPDGKLGILVGGGPAPGINGVIRAVTIEAVNEGYVVIGIRDGFKWLVRGEFAADSHTETLTIPRVSRIHFEGGSILRTSRENPTTDPQKMNNVLQNLRALGIRRLVTIGGDDTAFAASQLAQAAAGQMRVAHVPKTIDNDLPLPGNLPTFGFRTACEFGTRIVQNVMEDARTTNRWYFVVVMGRRAGHLALGIGNAAGATLTIIGEEFKKAALSVAEVGDMLEGAILKRRVQGSSHGLAIIAEGVAAKIPEEELSQYPFVTIRRDTYGNLRLSDLDLARILKSEVQRRFAERGEEFLIVTLDVGYALRCAPPVQFDQEYTRDLGYGAVRYLLDESASAESESGVMVFLEEGQLKTKSLQALLDSQTGRMQQRLVDVDTESYKVARKYMIRLEREDLEDDEMLQRLATAASTKDKQVAPGEIKERFGYLVGL